MAFLGQSCARKNIEWIINSVMGRVFASGEFTGEDDDVASICAFNILKL